MNTVSLMGVGSYLPHNVVPRDFFADPRGKRRGMFTAPTERRHVDHDESAADMIEKASSALIERLGIDAARDIDILFTNVSVPDQAFTGCGADVAAKLGIRPRWVIDLHNGGCVSFIYMMELARTLMQVEGARGALLCNVQNAGGRVFAQSEVRKKAQAPVPGDGCGVGYLARSEASPILSVVHRCNGEFAKDMLVAGDDGRRYWEAGESQLSVGFTDAKVAAIIHRGNSMVPEVVAAACAEARVRPCELALLVTNQPNPIFLRNWREALEVPKEAHHDTFDAYGNLFGAAIAINLEDAVHKGKLRAGDLVALGGFSHAGDYAAAAVVRWGGSA